MALEKQVVSIPLTKGVDTKSDKKQRIPGSLILLQNARFTAPGKILKRPGYVKLNNLILDSNSKITNGHGVTSFADELLESNGETLFSYSPSNEAWSSKGNLYNLSLTTTPVIRNNYQQTSQDSCYHPSGVQCFVWQDSSGGVRYSIIDYATKLQLVTDKLISINGINPKATYVGNYIVIFYYDVVALNLNYVTINVSNPTDAIVTSWIS